jgi:hypothetical protein
VLRNKFFTNQQDIEDSHPHTVERFDSTDNREMKSEIIENCFKRDGAKWRMDLDKKMFKECKKRCVRV